MAFEALQTCATESMSAYTLLSLSERVSGEASSRPIMADLAGGDARQVHVDQGLSIAFPAPAVASSTTADSNRAPFSLGTFSSSVPEALQR